MYVARLLSLSCQVKISIDELCASGKAVGYSRTYSMNSTAAAASTEILQKQHFRLAQLQAWLVQIIHVYAMTQMLKCIEPKL